MLIQQPLELNGVRSARAGIAGAQLRRVQAEAVVELRDLVLATKVSYFELSRAQEIRSLAQDLLKTAEEFHLGVRRQAEEGLRPQIEPVQTEVEVSRARLQLTQAESQVKVAQAALNALLGRGPETPVSVHSLAAGSTLGTQSPLPASPVDHAGVTNQALASRTEVVAEQALWEVFRQEGRLARASGRPDLAPQFRAGSVTRGLQSHGVGIGITLPILDYGSRRNRVRQAEASAKAQEARIESARNDIRREVFQALTRVEAATERVRQYRQGVLERVKRLLDASLRGLQLGAPGSSLLTVLEAQRTYRGVVTEYTTARADLLQAQAELERATGGISPTLLPIHSEGAKPEHESKQ